MFKTESTEGDEDCGGDFSENWKKMCLEDDHEISVSGVKRSKIDSEDIYVSLSNPFSSSISKKSSLRINDETIDHKLIRNINFD